MKVIQFSPPDIKRKDLKEVKKAIFSGWITTGPKTKQLEKIISNYCNVDNCVCLNSQTACAEMALRILGIGPGDEVIVPAYTYTATCSVVIHVGSTPIMVDSQKDSFEMDYEQLSSKINEKTKVIIPVDIGGVPCDYDKIFEIVNSKQELFRPSNNIQKAFNRIIILADTAHSLGGMYKGRRTGSIADFSAFSFHAVKNMTTAEGGALTWNNIEGIESDDIYHKIQLLSLHGQSKDALSKSKLGKWEYDIIGPWYKCNMTDILASLGISQMKRYNKILSKRRKIISLYINGLIMLPVRFLNHFDFDKQSSCHLAIVRILTFSEAQRNDFIEHMAKDGIACNVHYKPLPMFTAYQNLGYDINDYPNAHHLYQNEVTLPLHTKLSNKDIKRIIKSFIENYKLVISS